MSNSSGPAEASAAVFGERRAERPAAEQSIVTIPSIPERRDVVACVLRTPGSMAKPRWLGRAGLAEASLDRWPAVSMAAVDLETRPPSIVAGAPRIGRVQGYRGKACPIGEGFSPNQTVKAHLGPVSFASSPTGTAIRPNGKDRKSLLFHLPSRRSIRPKTSY